MSIVRCDFCQKNIDTDYDAEHFVPDTEYCLIQVEKAAPDMLKALMEINKYAGVQPYQFEKYIDSIHIISKQAIKKATS